MVKILTYTTCGDVGKSDSKKEFLGKLNLSMIAKSTYGITEKSILVNKF